MDDFPRHVGTALLQSHRAQGFAVSHASPHLVVSRHFQKLIHFFVEILGMLLPAK